MGKERGVKLGDKRGKYSSKYKTNEERIEARKASQKRYYLRKKEILKSESNQSKNTLNQNINGTVNNSIPEPTKNSVIENDTTEIERLEKYVAKHKRVIAKLKRKIESQKVEIEFLKVEIETLKKAENKTLKDKPINYRKRYPISDGKYEEISSEDSGNNKNMDMNRSITEKEIEEYVAIRKKCYGKSLDYINMDIEEILANREKLAVNNS
jgi:hypothetical protein